MSRSARNIVSVLSRIYVDDIDEALPLYESLSSGESAHRFEYRDIKLAKVGVFLLIQGADDEIRTHTSTVSVRDLGPVVTAIESASGEVLEGPDPGPNGARLIARHPDGAIIEYIESA